MTYEEQAAIQLQFWQHKMQKKPSLGDRIAKGLQDKINDIIPEKIHAAITVAIEKMVKGVLFGAQHTTSSPKIEISFQMTEVSVKNRIAFYQKTASIEGAVTGAGGFLMGLADFPILIALKLKLLFEIAALYGYDVDDYKERLYILYIFQLAFSSQQKRNEVYKIVADWEAYSVALPEYVEHFNWLTFQQEYRDYIDLAKMAQLLPVIGAAVGAIVNYKLVAQLGDTAMNCYRMRLQRKQLKN
ncbi:EcsC family protein [Mucilaginibacter auburnensis]|uniref:EcsC family protein n=1 Tax=Mucilaginibacter auburnensis TaxID=1457233 RepID=A0A2H9VN43_9SPHI|nr:EcsC family protein [Mucilaginibacter auburnensis]PJJ79751.1 EcsC family protein [Mucilaginibacter auburnensis]